MEEIKTTKAPAAIGPYSQAIKIGNLLFTSGQIPIDPIDDTISDAIEEQAEQAFTNVKNLIESAGASIENVVKTTVFIKDMADFPVINEIYAKYFTKPYPARSCVEVARLPKDVLLEVETIVSLD